MNSPQQRPRLLSVVTPQSHPAVTVRYRKFGDVELAGGSRNPIGCNAMTQIATQ